MYIAIINFTSQGNFSFVPFRPNSTSKIDRRIVPTKPDHPFVSKPTISPIGNQIVRREDCREFNDASLEPYNQREYIGMSCSFLRFSFLSSKRQSDVYDFFFEIRPKVLKRWWLKELSVYFRSNFNRLSSIWENHLPTNRFSRRQIHFRPIFVFVNLC